MSSSLPNNNSNNDFVAINIKDSSRSRSYPPSSKLFCNLCNCSLVLIDPKAEEWLCSRCHISYYPSKGEKVKRASKFDTPGPPVDKDGNNTPRKGPVVSMVDDSAATTIPKKGSFPRSLEALKRTGVNITSFNSTVDDEGL
jgi:hypothetical protein